MRRKEREVSDREEISRMLALGRVMTLALCDGSTPYAVPVNFGHAEGRLYFHCAPEGRKLDLIARNPVVAFNVVCQNEIVTNELPCGWTAKYLSVSGTGRARVVEGSVEKEHGLGVIMAHHGGPATGFNPAHLERTAVVEIELLELTGKANA